MHRYSALQTHYTVGKHSSKNNILIFKEIKNLQIMQVAVWHDKINEIKKELISYFSISDVPSFNKGIAFANSALWRMEPLKWWIINNNFKVSEEIATTLDMSHAFTAIEIVGTNSSLFLNRHLPIDLRSKNFPDMSSASSAIHHVSVKLFKLSTNKFCLYIPRGFALSIWDILLETADQFGYEVLDT